MRCRNRCGVLTFILLLPLTLVAAVTAGYGQTVDAMQELQACAKIEQTDARVQCYESLGQRALEQESPPQAMESPEPVESQQELLAEPEPAPVAVGATAVAATAAVEAAPVQEATSGSSVQQMPNDIGGQQFEEDDKAELYVDRVTSCEKSADSKWNFYFKSGQVWKQVSSRRVVLDDDACQFSAMVTKDFFGYKMQIEGEKGKIRISRLK